MPQGRIMRQTGGFYYVQTESQTLECRARGLFRKDGVTPLVGDIAEVDLTEPGKGFVTALLPRKNEMKRPPVANVDLLLLILSIVDPAPNRMVLDRMLAIAAHKDIDAALVITKADLADAQPLAAVYRAAGYPVRCINSLQDRPDELLELFAGRLCVLAGNTGVGKSTLLNALDPAVARATGETSRKLGRGRHTTRVTELFVLGGGLVADTPGFSALETVQMERIKKDELELCFREFAPYLGHCRYTGCSHTKERDCAVLAALQNGAIDPGRHQSYLAMYEEARQLKDWEDEA